MNLHLTVYYLHNGFTLDTQVDADSPVKADEILSSKPEVMEFRNAFVDEMTKQTEDSQINLSLDQKASDDTRFKYKLLAIIAHLGNSGTQCGHYVADVFRYYIHSKSIVFHWRVSS